MSFPAREPPPSADASLPLRFDDSDRDVLARAFRTPGEGPSAWRLNREAHRISLVDGFDRLLAWPVLHDVTRYDHQERTALRVLRDMRGRAILADEVGLGKTIEAGLVLKEYAVRGLVQRALVLTPAALTNQWREEMETKFSLPFAVLRSVRDWDRKSFLIASMDTAKREPHRGAAQARPWDLIVVDEAHRLKNRLSLNWRFVAGLSKKYMLLLTATPVQNDMDELFNLVTLLKPGQLHTYDRFLERYVASPDRRVPMRVPELRGLLRDVMVRNRRGIAFTLPPRRVHSLAVRLGPAERRLYDDVTEFVRDAYWSASGRLPWTARLTLIVLQREIGSSTFAVAETLRRLAQSPLFRMDERERLEELRHEAVAISATVKAARLREFLRSADEKVLIFTQSLRTLQYLQGVLETDGYRVAAYHGGLSLAAKDAAVRTFREDRDIFLSTEAGGRGTQPPVRSDRRQLRSSVEPAPDRATDRAGPSTRSGPRGPRRERVGGGYRRGELDGAPRPQDPHVRARRGGTRSDPGQPRRASLVRGPDDGHLGPAGSGGTAVRAAPPRGFARPRPGPV